VQPSDYGFELVSGERRLRAASIAGHETVPVIIVNPDESAGSLEIALVENVQRTDLNALELAKAFNRLHEEFDRTQDEIARIVGKSRSYVANTLRLLELSENIQSALREGTITAGHARAILMAPESERESLFKKITNRGLSVRQAEHAAKAILTASEKPKVAEQAESPMDIDTERVLKEMEKALETALGRKCVIEHRKDGRGRIVLEYYDEKDLENLVQKLT
jgi:ParB family chromosome partitioning protein